MMIKRFLRGTTASALAAFLTLGTIAGGALTLSGCQKQNNDITESIVLNDPVGSTLNYATVERRDLYNYSVLNGKVVPSVYEYGFPSNQVFESYVNLPGMPVNKNDGLVKASTEKLDDETKAVKESMSDMMEEYNDDMDEYREQLAVAKSHEEYWKGVVDNLNSMTDAELANYNATAGRGWNEDACRSQYSAAIAARERLELNISERSDNYDLDIAHLKTRLNRLATKRSDVVVSSKIDGTVVAIRLFEDDKRISKNVPVAGVGDFNNLEIKTEYVVTNEIKRAVDVFGFCNGKRYEVEFVEPEANAVISSMADARSTFHISDPSGEIKAGDYVLIVVVSRQSLDALSIPTDAIGKDDEGSFVYVRSGESAVKRQIKVGIKSGMYTEVLSGLNEGEEVSVDVKSAKLSRTAVLEKGSVSTAFSASGYLFYSNGQGIMNPIEWGTAYIKELVVKPNQRVVKGETIATIWVTADDLAIRRKERAILRANEDLNELIKAGEEDNKRAIKNKREYINELTKQVGEMKADGATTEIKAPFDGIITDTYHFEEGDILLPDQWIASISSEDNCYVVIEDKAGQLTCGNTASIEYKDANDQNAIANGEVVTVTSWALSDELKADFTLIRVSSEDLEKMAGANMGAGGWWRRVSFSVKADVREVKDVVLVPKSAVTLVDGITYVTVEENGKQTLKSFIAGGSDSTNYWVVDGLSEGTKICLE